jgi:Bacterial toxin 23
MLTSLLFAQLSVSQPTDLDSGIRIGLSYQFGTQGNRVGLNTGAFIRSNASNTEAFLSWSAYRNFSHIETTQPGLESQLTLGVTQGFGGGRKLPDNNHWSIAANNTDKDNSISLYTTFYKDTYKTSQRVLGIGLNLGHFNIRFEDDYDPSRILGDYGDRFRTGALEIGYKISEGTNFVAGFNTFTGDPEEGGVISPGKGALGPHGDYNMVRPDGSPVTARDRSIGNIYLGVRNLDLTQSADDSYALRALGFDNMQVRIGWSSEEIRDITQNSLHDLINNPRIPLRKIQGKPYLEFGTNQGQTLYP